MFIRCSNCGKFKDKKELNCILGAWVCKDCYSGGSLYCDGLKLSDRESFSDFPYASSSEDLCSKLVKSCCISFDTRLMTCKNCVCYNYCKNKNNTTVETGFNRSLDEFL